MRNQTNTQFPSDPEASVQARPAQAEDYALPMIIVSQTCLAFSVRLLDLRSPSRRTEFTWPRHTICHLLDKMAGFTLKQSGELVGHLDPSTVSHSLKTCQDRIATEPKFAAKVAEIEAAITVELEAFRMLQAQR